MLTELCPMHGKLFSQFIIRDFIIMSTKLPIGRLDLGTSILRPEASKHRVCWGLERRELMELVGEGGEEYAEYSSRRQKLEVVEELWEHFFKFHLKQTKHVGFERKELVGEGGEEYTEYRWRVNRLVRRMLLNHSKIFADFEKFVSQTKPWLPPPSRPRPWPSAGSSPMPLLARLPLRHELNLHCEIVLTFYA